MKLWEKAINYVSDYSGLHSDSIGFMNFKRHEMLVKIAYIGLITAGAAILIDGISTPMFISEKGHMSKVYKEILDHSTIKED